MLALRFALIQVQVQVQVLFLKRQMAALLRTSLLRTFAIHYALTHFAIHGEQDTMLYVHSINDAMTRITENDTVNM